MGLAAFFLVLISPFVYGYVGMMELADKILPGSSEVIQTLLSVIYRMFG